MFYDVKLPLGLNLRGNNLETQLYVEVEQINLSMIYCLSVSPLKKEEVKEFGGQRKDVTLFFLLQASYSIRNQVFIPITAIPLFQPWIHLGHILTVEY